jgi:hypothetical protein
MYDRGTELLQNATLERKYKLKQTRANALINIKMLEIS